MSNEKSGVYLWGVKNNQNNDFIYDYSINSFGEGIIKKVKSSDIVWFHNLSGDGEFLVHHLVNQGFIFTTERKPAPNHFFGIKDLRSHLYIIKVGLKNKCITFRCTYKIFVASVKQMGDALGLEKKELDYSKYYDLNLIKPREREKVITYCERDVDVMKQYFLIFQQTIPKIKITIASTSKANFIDNYGFLNFASDFGGKNFKYHRVVNYINKVMWKNLRMGYKGGLTIFNNNVVGKVLKVKNGCVYDVNSLYPYLMKTQPFPYGRPLRHPPDGDYLTLIKVGIKKAVKRDKRMPSHLGINPMRHQTKSKTRAYTDKIKDVYYILTEQEGTLIKETYYCEYMEMTKWYFRAKPIFGNWVKLKEKLKNEAPDKVQRQIHKIIQNSLYGKFGQNHQIQTRILAFDKEHQTTLGRRYGNGDVVEKIVMDERDDTSYLPVAIFTTSYARCYLLRAIMKNLKDFIYADTDSIISKNPLNLNIHPFKYGDGKMEQNFNRIKILKPKCYLLGDDKGITKRVISGLRKSSHSLIKDFDDFYDGRLIENGNLVRKGVKGGLILVKRRYLL